MKKWTLKVVQNSQCIYIIVVAVEKSRSAEKDIIMHFQTFFFKFKFKRLQRLRYFSTVGWIFVRSLKTVANWKKKKLQLPVC